MLTDRGAAVLAGVNTIAKLINLIGGTITYNDFLDGRIPQLR